MADDTVIKKKIKAGGGNSSTTRTTMADRMKEAKTRPPVSQGVEAAKPKPPAPKPAPKPVQKGIPSGGGNSSVTRTTQPQGSWSDKAKEAAGRGKPKGAPSVSARPGVGGALLRGFGRVAGPLGALVGMTTPAGAGSDTPKGPLMKGNRSTFRKEGTRPDSVVKEGPNANSQRSSYKMSNPTQRPYDAKTSPKRVPKPTAKPEDIKEPKLPDLKVKSKTRAAFEKEFAKNRRAGKKEFTFRGKKYNTKTK